MAGLTKRLFVKTPNMFNPGRMRSLTTKLPLEKKLQKLIDDFENEKRLTPNQVKSIQSNPLIFSQLPEKIKTSYNEYIKIVLTKKHKNLKDALPEGMKQKFNSTPSVQAENIVHKKDVNKLSLFYTGTKNLSPKEFTDFVEDFLNGLNKCSVDQINATQLQRLLRTNPDHFFKLQDAINTMSTQLPYLTYQDISTKIENHFHLIKRFQPFPPKAPDKTSDSPDQIPKSDGFKGLAMLLLISSSQKTDTVSKETLKHLATKILYAKDNSEDYPLLIKLSKLSNDDRESLIDIVDKRFNSVPNADISSSFPKWNTIKDIFQK